MRLKKSRPAAEEQLTSLVNEGYQALGEIQRDYQRKTESKNFDPGPDNKRYEDLINDWGRRVLAGLDEIFPTKLENNTFANPQTAFGTISGSIDYQYGCLTSRLRDLISGLDNIISRNLDRYTDLPQQSKLYIEDIDSFRKVRDVNPSMVAHYLTNGYFERSEEEVQLGLEQILDVSFHKKDWGGEVNDLYTANVVVNGARTASAFLLKGKGLKKKVMEISDCGKNGDQLVRLLDSPAKLFVVQFVGVISENVMRDIEGKVTANRAHGKASWYLIMDGQDTARLLHAYGKL